ncbi:MAG TPA: hypothetical protein VMV44_16515 [Rectinemataceae bacterium]|nr:hypothetical protein [Rectinemataceae bacterium]
MKWNFDLLLDLAELALCSISKDKVAVWLYGHDSYHCAQNRNMAVPGLKRKRAY